MLILKNSCLKLIVIFKNVLTAILITPGKLSLINSNSFLQTVYKKLIFYYKNLWNYPTRYLFYLKTLY